jgi:hypothetical protein
MRVFRVLVSYPPTKRKPERSRAVFLGEMKVGDKNGLHSLVDGYGDMLQLLKKVNKGKDVVKPNSLTTYDKVTLNNGVIIYLDTDPAESLETWLKRASEFDPAADDPSPKKSKKK